jgi:acyl-CoA thioesterase-2
MEADAVTDLAEVLALLDIEHLDNGLFRGFQPAARPPRVFGGQVVAQGLRAAGHTTPDGRLPHSLHAYFIRPGHTRAPIVYEVARLRDGGTISSRKVTAVQDGEIICEIMASFAKPGDPEDRTDSLPSVPGPDELPTLHQRLAAYADELDGWWVRERPFDIRPVTPPPRAAMDELDEIAEPVSQVWLRAVGPVPDAPMLHCCLLAYVSDITLLEPVLIARRVTTVGPGSVASLDHAMWFHRMPDLSDWLLYDKKVLGASSVRGLAGGRLFARTGDLVCTVTQEGYLSSHAPSRWSGPRLHSSMVNPSPR